MLQLNTAALVASATPMSVAVSRTSVEPVYAATRRHREAWEAFQVAEGDDDSLCAQAEEQDALLDLMSISPRTSGGIAELRRHLRWYYDEDHAVRDWTTGANGVAFARLTDLDRIVDDARSAEDGHLGRILKAALPFWREGYDTAMIAWFLTLDRVGVIGEAEVATALARHRDGTLAMPEVA